MRCRRSQGRAGRRRFRRHSRAGLPSVSLVASRESRSAGRRRVPRRDARSPVRRGARRRLERASRRRRHLGRRLHERQVRNHAYAVCGAQGQGCRRRSVPRAHRRAAVGRRRRARRALEPAPRPRHRDAGHRSLGRQLASSRLSRRAGCGAAQGESGCRDVAAFGLGEARGRRRRRARLRRSDVRLGQSGDRGCVDRGRRRARTAAQRLRFPPLAGSRRGGLAAAADRSGRAARRSSQRPRRAARLRSRLRGRARDARQRDTGRVREAVARRAPRVGRSAGGAGSARSRWP